MSTLQTHLNPQRLGGWLIVSLALHAALLAAFSWMPSWAGVPVSLLADGHGGGQLGPSVSVSLLGELDGGDASLYKPSLRPKDPVEAAPPVSRPSPVASRQSSDPGINKDAIVLSSGRVKAQPTAALPKTVPTAGNKVPNTVAEPGAGGVPASAGSGGGIGGGIGLDIGSGSGGEQLNSWYARQVQRRIGDNWLRGSLEGFRGQRLRAVVSFVILDDGRLDEVDFSERSGNMHYDLVAYRAVQAANPLPPLPPELRGRRIRFLAYFNFPIGSSGD